MTPPVNDNSANAVTIPPGSGTLGPYVIDDATVESGESTSFGYKSIWFKFTAFQNATVNLSTVGSPAGDAESGDGDFPPYGNLDTMLEVRQDSPTGTVVASNDDFGGLGSQVNVAAFYPYEYWVRVGVYDPSYTGSVILRYIDVPEALPPFVDVIPECPVQVDAIRPGRTSSYIAPHGGEFGVFNDGYAEWYEPAYRPGELLLWIGTGDKTDVTAPAGYTEVFNGLWDDADTSNPSPRGSTLGPYANYPVNGQHVQLIVAYRITTDTLTFGSGPGQSESTVKGTISPLRYSDHSYSVQDAASGGDGNNCFAVRVYSFKLEQMFDGFPDVDTWPVNPVKVGTLVSSVYQRDLWTGGTYDPHPFDLAVPDTTADHIGNHIYMTLVMTHGNVEPTGIRTFDPDPRRTTLDLRDQFVMRASSFDDGGIRTTSPPNGTIFEGDHHYNDINVQPWLSNRNYFEPYIPESWVPAGITGDAALTWSAENGFSDTTPAPGHSIQGSASSTGGSLWHDGGLGVEGTDWYNWTLTGAGGLIQIVIQGPEVTRPPNDLRENAYEITTCPVTLVECVYGQTNDGDAPWDGLGDSATNAGVWFKYVADATQPDLSIHTWLPGFLFEFTTYDTILIVYDSDFNIIASSDDDGPQGRLSDVTVSVVAGATYYIQVAGYGGDEGDLYLTIENCQELLAYWGVLAGVM